MYASLDTSDLTTRLSTTSTCAEDAAIAVGWFRSGVQLLTLAAPRPSALSTLSKDRGVRRCNFASSEGRPRRLACTDAPLQLPLGESIREGGDWRGERLQSQSDSGTRAGMAAHAQMAAAGMHTATAVPVPPTSSATSLLSACLVKLAGRQTSRPASTALEHSSRTRTRRSRSRSRPGHLYAPQAHLLRARPATLPCAWRWRSVRFVLESAHPSDLHLHRIAASP